MKPKKLTNKTKTDSNPNPPKTLPTAYVMWLTVRSKFIDHLTASGKINHDDWLEFENLEIQKLQAEQGDSLNLNKF